MKYLRRFEKCLINPTWDQMIERDPLLIFSLYLSGRVNVLFLVADEILENLDQAFSSEGLDMRYFERADALIWMWTLGAYEVVRTMCQAKGCFSSSAYDRLAELKKILSDIRMPAAKMERMGKKQPMNSNRSPSGWDVQGKDLLIFKSESDCYMSARFILGQVDDIFSSFTKEDVLKKHEESYQSQA
jgi:hypothetical protein